MPRAEQVFDNLTRIASKICRMPISLVFIVDASRQRSKAHIGMETREPPKEWAFCAHDIQQDDIFEIQDATQDSRFTNNPLVVGEPNIRHYAGMPLKTPAGYNIGTLCVIDTKPNKLSDEQKVALKTLAEQVIYQMQLRVKQKESKEFKEELTKTKFSHVAHRALRQSYP